MDAVATGLGRRMRVNLPNDIIITCIEARPVFGFSEDFSPDMAYAVLESVAKAFSLTILSPSMNYKESKDRNQLASDEFTISPGN